MLEETLCGFTSFTMHIASITKSTPTGGLFNAFTSAISFLFNAFKLSSAAWSSGFTSPVCACVRNSFSFDLMINDDLNYEINYLM